MNDSLVTLLSSMFRLPQMDAMAYSLWRIAAKIFRRYTKRGLYEVIDHSVCLELLDNKGHFSRYTKQQTVRFLQDNVFAYQDQAYGDGDIFASYQCSPGVPVDRYREGQIYRILISLHEPRQFGDIEHFRVDRTIKDGYVGSVQDFQTHVEHIMRHMSLSVIFPINCVPTRVFLIEQSTKRTRQLGAEAFIRLPTGQTQVIWESSRPRLFENYILRWEW